MAYTRSSAPPVSRYEYVRALFIGWEACEADTAKEAQGLKSMREQSQSLMKVLKRLYKFEVEEYNIPRAKPYPALSKKLIQVQETHDNPKQFLVIYYAGHGDMDHRTRHAIWKCYNTPSSPKVDWTSLQETFLTDESSLDVLMIIDCCRAGSSTLAPTASSTTGNIVFVLAACGFDNNTPLHGDTTYTTNLIAELSDERILDVGQTVLYIASAVYNRLYHMVLPSGRCGVSSTSYVLRDSPRMLRLMPQRSLVTWSAWKGGDQTAHMSLSSTEQVSNDLERTDFAASDNGIHPVTMQLTGSHRGTPLQESQPGSLGRQRDNHSNEVPSAGNIISGPTALSLSASAQKNNLDNLLRDISFPGMFDRRLSVSLAAPHTFNWIYTLDSFLRWTSAANGTFWISGKAGAGKSTLMKLLASSDHVRTMLLQQSKSVAFSNQIRNLLSCSSPEEGVTVVSHMFWGPGRPLQRTLSGLYRSLIYQLLKARPELISVATEVCGREGLTHMDMLVFVSRLRRLWESLIQSISQRSAGGIICIFVDGLDECEDASSVEYESLKTMATLPGVKLCVASRPWDAIADVFHDVPLLQLEHYTLADIKLFVHSNLEPYFRYERQQELADLTEDTVRRSEGVFLWVVLTVQSLRDGLQGGESTSSLKARLGEIPTNLKHLFIEILERTIRASGSNSTAVCIYQILRASQAEVVGLTGLEVEPLLTTVALYYALELVKSNQLAIQEAVRPLQREELHDINLRIRTLLSEGTRGMIQADATNPESSGTTGSAAAISYMHQSARRFFEEDYTVSLIARNLPTNFDANVVLLGSTIIQLKHLSDHERYSDDIRGLQWWPIVEIGMNYASKVQSGHTALFARFKGMYSSRDGGHMYPEEVSSFSELCLRQYLDELDRIVTLQLETINASAPHCHWSSFLPLSGPEHSQSHDSFLSLAVEYAIELYVQQKLIDTPSLITEKAGRPLLDYAIFPTCTSSRHYGPARTRIVAYILLEGADLLESFHEWEIRERLLGSIEHAERQAESQRKDTIDGECPTESERHIFLRDVLQMLQRRAQFQSNSALHGSGRIQMRDYMPARVRAVYRPPPSL